MKTIVFVTPKNFRGLSVWKDGKQVVKFQPRGDMGTFATDDPKRIEEIRGLREYGTIIKEFKGEGVPKFESPTEILKGGLTSVTQQQIEEKEEVDKDKLIRFGELKGKLLKKDGNYRGDADPDEIAEYEELKELFE